MKKCYIESKYRQVLIPVLNSLSIRVVVDPKDAEFFIIDSNNSFKMGDRPVMILSTSNVYSCLDSNNKVKEIPFSEDSPLVIPSSLTCYNQILDILFENKARIHNPNNIVLRTCGVYGDSLNSNIVFDMLNTFKNSDEYLVWHSLYRKKSFLYIEDFKVILSKVISLFLEGLRGVYNIGGIEAITIKNLAYTVHQMVHKTVSKPRLSVIDISSDFTNFYEVVNINRIQALTSWKPEYSIRRGLDSYIQSVSWKIKS